MVNEFKIKQQICEVGRRLYERAFVAANDGNISYRIGENEVLCSPTLVSKGFMKPDDICTIDLTGKQLAGRRKRTSEALLHLEIYKVDPEVKAVGLVAGPTSPKPETRASIEAIEQGGGRADG